jgi:hypothetical protein
MSDTRELILDRLLAISTEVAGFTSAVRNRGLLSTEKRPAIILLDGRETPVLTHGGRTNRARNGMLMPLTPSVMSLEPEIYMLLDENRPTNVKDDVNVGTRLGGFRVALIKAIAEDAELLSLLGANGGMLYNGYDTDLKSGGALSGQMRLDFQFRYTFFPTTNQQGAS